MKCGADAKAGHFYTEQLRYTRKRRKYHADRSRFRRYHGNGGMETCIKFEKGSKKFTPGIWSLLCQHGVCHGFTFLRKHEGPSTPFELFYDRFKIAPKLITYDNACHMHRYFLLREPNFFAKTKCRIDDLHWKNHKACQVGYAFKQYRRTDPSVRHLNTAVSEQAHSTKTKGLRLIEEQIHWMRSDNVIPYVRSFYERRNNEIMKKDKYQRALKL